MDSNDPNGEAAQAKCRNRHLNDPDKVFEHNAWDDVEWSADQVKEAEEIIEKHMENKATEETRLEYETNAALYWDAFYQTHQDKFFKDRHWLFDEFPELRRAAQLDKETIKNGSSADAQDLPETTQADRSTGVVALSIEQPTSAFTVFEVGCGPGNTVIPLLEATRGSPHAVFIYACDFSATAIRLLQTHASFDTNRSRAFVFDVSCSPESEPETPVAPASCDVVLLLFTLSAIAPVRHETVLRRVHSWLKPGGAVLLRDYAHFDLAELRFEPASRRCLAKHEYARGDGTLACFFDAQQIEQMFTLAGFSRISINLDRRLQTNRARRLKMYRAFIQAKFVKPLKTDS